ncbi:hypothetical protein P7C70_g2869, partial [Phenoliferia sp. Uapishka_3]
MASVSLDLRGERITIERESLMNLPESVLLCLFPNGVVLSPQRQPRLDGQPEEEVQEDVYFVDFDAQCLEFVLNFFNTARDDFYGPPEGPRRDLAESIPSSQSNMQNPLFLKQAIIVLREELEYFAIPPKGTAIKGEVEGEESTPKTNEAGHPNTALLKLKVDSGNALLARKSIFTALQRNVNRENNVAEQHLIDMLCMRYDNNPSSIPLQGPCSLSCPSLFYQLSGFEREDTWGYRSLEPNRCCIASIALVLLKTGIVHPPITDPSASPSSTDGTVDRSPKVNAQQLATAQKLLLFWRKPARKCWWDATEVTLGEGTPEAREIKVWARRVWTLELSLI